jgi:hypothetical protein
MCYRWYLYNGILMIDFNNVKMIAVINKKISKKLPEKPGAIMIMKIGLRSRIYNAAKPYYK